MCKVISELKQLNKSFLKVVNLKVILSYSHVAVVLSSDVSLKGPLLVMTVALYIVPADRFLNVKVRLLPSSSGLLRLPLRLLNRTSYDSTFPAGASQDTVMVLLL